VLGYSIGNDVSERAWQKSDRTLWRAKNTDTFKPMGPWVETDVELDALETRVRVNGVETTRFRTNDMLFGIATYISTITRYVTLVPGDIVWMGTDGTSPDLKAGDTVEVEIAGIGTLRNPFVAAASQRRSGVPGEAALLPEGFSPTLRCLGAVAGNATSEPFPTRCAWCAATTGSAAPGRSPRS
jgi:hypothetical protein